MHKNIEDLFLINRDALNQSKRLINQLFFLFLSRMNKEMTIVKNLGNYNYFNNYLTQIGSGKIKEILCKEVSDSDDLLDLLEYRIMVIEMDIENDNFDSIIESFIDSVDAIHSEFYKEVKND